MAEITRGPRPGNLVKELLPASVGALGFRMFDSRAVLQVTARRIELFLDVKLRAQTLRTGPPSSRWLDSCYV